jgi:hypothetical protein
VPTELLRSLEGFVAKIAFVSTFVLLFKVVHYDSSWWQRRRLKFSHFRYLYFSNLFYLRLARILSSKHIGRCIVYLSRVFCPIRLKFLDRGFVLQLSVKQMDTSKVICDFGKEVRVS